MLREKSRIQENTNNQKKLWKFVIFPHSTSNNTLSLFFFFSLYVSLCIFLADNCPQKQELSFFFSLILISKYSIFSVQAGTSWDQLSPEDFRYICVAQMYAMILILYESNMAVSVFFLSLTQSLVRVTELHLHYYQLHFGSFRSPHVTPSSQEQLQFLYYIFFNDTQMILFK